MRFDIITAFPNAFSYLQESIPKRAQEKGKVEINIIDLRDFGIGRWHKIDDRPFGGGAGMVLQVEPIYRALKSLGVYPRENSKVEISSSKKIGGGKGRMINDKKNTNDLSRTKVYLMSARGKTWHQKYAESSVRDLDRIVLICGHYEGVDQRVVDELIDEEISIGNFILSGGELASMIIVDSITRLIDDVVGRKESIERETAFNEDSKAIEYPHYSRPETFVTDEGESWGVPDILLSGNHKNIEKWKDENTVRKEL